jgi:hypothetical protein
MAPSAKAQSPGVAIPAAFNSMIGRWCKSRLALSDTTVTTFSSVRFVQARCNNEHDEALWAIVGLDADSVLYLLASDNAFNFLVARHPPALLKEEAAVVAYAQTAMILAGYGTPNDRLVTTWTELPVAARDSAQKVAVRPVQVVRSGGSWWDLRIFLRGESAWGPTVRCFDVIVESNGRLVLARKVWAWQAGYGP